MLEVFGHRVPAVERLVSSGEMEGQFICLNAARAVTN